MLYLIRPNGTMEWNDLPANLLPMVADHGGDLGRLDWQPSDSRPDDTTIALALRYGTACTGGIAIDAGYLAAQQQPGNIARTHAQAAESHQALAAANNEFMEQIVPGWTESGRKLDARVEAGAEQAIADAERDVRELLNKRDAVPDLAAHWKTIHGHIPDSPED